jgi:hypothetical protein
MWLYLGLNSRDFAAIPYLPLPVHPLHTVWVWLLSINNERENRTFSASIRESLMEPHTWHSLWMPKKRYVFDCDSSVIKWIFTSKTRNLLGCIRPPLQESFWNFPRSDFVPPSKEPLFWTNRNQIYKVSKSCVMSMEFQENPCNASQGMADKKICSQVKCLFIQNSIHTCWFGVCVEGHNFNAFRIEMMSWNGREMGFGME